MRLNQRWLRLFVATIAMLLPVALSIAWLIGSKSSASTRSRLPVKQSPTLSSNQAVTATHPPLEPTFAAMITELRSPDIPPLPFPDNPDPSQCGIPVPWGSDNRAWLTGIYEGRMVQPVVLLYDSHLRFNIAARAEHGSEVEIILYQQNPVTDYYLVKIKGAEPPNDGWVPGPFLSFEPVSTLRQ